MSKTIREELKDKYLASGGRQENLTNDSQTIAGIIHATNDPATTLKRVTVEPVADDTVLNDYTGADFQTGVQVKDGKITGKLKYVDHGSVVDTWGAGYFVALQFTVNEDDPTSVKVGLNPSISSGLVELLGDPDMNGYFKVSNKQQSFVVQQTVNGVTSNQFYDLTGLIMLPATEE